MAKYNMWSITSYSLEPWRKEFAACGFEGITQLKTWGTSGFSTRHWQQIQKGRPVTGRAILRICDAFRTSMPDLLRGLDRGIYTRSDIAVSPKKLAARATLRRKRLS